MNNTFNINHNNITKNNLNNNNNNQQHHHHHHRISNGTQACAACKNQRRKCAPDCVLAPYFPHDRQRQFLNAHKLFGVSNITKIIRHLNPPDKDIAMQTIMFQSDARAKDPVGGCYRIIRDLHHQMEYCKAELHVVLQQLAICKAQAYQQRNQIMQINQQGVVPVVEDDSNNNNSNKNNDEGNNDNNNNDEHYQHYQETLMRCYYEGGENENEQFSWGPQDEAVLASSNSSNSHGECFMVKQDFGGECDDLAMKLMRLDSGEPATCDVRDHDVDVSCGVIQSEELKFGSHSISQLSEEIVLKENKIILGN